MVFLMMVIALALPMGRFFIARKANESVHLPSRRLAVSLLIAIPMAALALYSKPSVRGLGCYRLWVSHYFYVRFS